MAQLNFDASQVAPDTGGGDPVPAGWYNVMIDESEMKPTKAEGGLRLSLRFTIMDGQYANRKVFTGLNLKNANPVAQEIAYKQLSAICHAVGVMQVQDSQQLHGRPLKIKVKVKAAQGDYEASNDITAYKNINEQVDGPAAGGAPTGAPWATAQAPAPQAAPWAGQPAAAPVAPAQQFAPQQPAPAQAAPAWQPPAAQQPWAQAPAQAPAPQFQQPVQQPAQQFQQPAPQAAPPQQAAPAQAPGAVPPWMQQAAAPAAGATPPWAAPQQ
jgi:hypothetical protein